VNPKSRKSSRGAPVVADHGARLGSALFVIWALCERGSVGEARASHPVVS
jgi:hypothetical protein